MIDVRLSEAFVQGILNGEFDSELDSIGEAVSLRRRAVAMAKASAIRVGDRIKAVRITPKYLRGIEGVVTGRDEKWISVSVDGRYNTGRYSHNLKLPHSSVERINDDSEDGK